MYEDLLVERRDFLVCMRIIPSSRDRLTDQVTLKGIEIEGGECSASLWTSLDEPTVFVDLLISRE